jgi:hypothetical protein
MKRTLILATGLLLCALFASAGTFVVIDVSCATITSVYANVGTVSEKITIQATDKCSGADSEVQLVDASGTVTGHFRLKDRTTKAFNIVVPVGYSLNLVCNGDSGGCSYSISVQ